MISAWDVYWVMQLDSISSFLAVCSFLVFAASAAIFLLVVPEASDDEEAKKVLKVCVKFVAVSFFLGTFSVLLPSSKTAAAMIILPAVTSEEAVNMVKPEAKELYELTKDALRSMITEKTTKEVEK